MSMNGVRDRVNFPSPTPPLLRLTKQQEASGEIRSLLKIVYQIFIHRMNITKLCSAPKLFISLNKMANGISFSRSLKCHLNEKLSFDFKRSIVGVITMTTMLPHSN